MAVSRSSPALFIISQDLLSRNLHRLISAGRVLPYSSYHTNSYVSHLLYADDSLVLSNGSKASLQHIMKLFSVYEGATKEHKSKSCFLTSDPTPIARKNLIATWTGFTDKQLPFRSFVAPLFRYLDLEAEVQFPSFRIS